MEEEWQPALLLANITLEMSCGTMEVFTVENTFLYTYSSAAKRVGFTVST